MTQRQPDRRGTGEFVNQPVIRLDVVCACLSRLQVFGDRSGRLVGVVVHAPTCPLGELIASQPSVVATEGKGGTPTTAVSPPQPRQPQSASLPTPPGGSLEIPKIRSGGIKGTGRSWLGRVAARRSPSPSLRGHDDARLSGDVLAELAGGGVDDGADLASVSVASHFESSAAAARHVEAGDDRVDPVAGP